MKKPQPQFMIAGFLLAFLVVVPRANSAPPHDPDCPLKYMALAETEPVTGNPAGGVKLFEITRLETGCYDEVRVFVHVMNDHYQTSPFPANARIDVRAYHGIGRGSWGYFADRFPREVTSQLYGLSQIPVIGEQTRLVVFGYNLPAVELQVDVAAYLVN